MTAPVGFFTTNELALMPCTPVLNTAVRLVLVGTAVAFGAGPREVTVGVTATGGLGSEDSSGRCRGGEVRGLVLTPGA